MKGRLNHEGTKGTQKGNAKDSNYWFFQKLSSSVVLGALSVFVLNEIFVSCPALKRAADLTNLTKYGIVNL